MCLGAAARCSEPRGDGGRRTPRRLFPGAFLGQKKGMILRFVRWFLSRILLVLDRLTVPAPMVRDPARQAEVDRECAKLALYQFVGCPFCIKVRRQIRRLGLRIELRDAAEDATHRETLVREGGELQVPCLRIEAPEGVRWMYESSEINAWLAARFGEAR